MGAYWHLAETPETASRGPRNEPGSTLVLFPSEKSGGYLIVYPGKGRGSYKICFSEEQVCAD